ncbi:hypothetical protein [Stratiformator vulcanicus]|uniref:Uncharacterized protein n=1 Tax=Stratiformator vulcanicus TaxID=2527980 RepID=A0A517QWS3_9PLAN|nr:hypothetical protein [Stratiformator vulcanicus]QDT36020.1 hypothetical protein Pan189_03750 [Stratiformator vulcanicus]
MTGFADIRTLSGDELRESDALFPAEIDQDSWVQYHATSSSNEAKIDAEGLRWSPNLFSVEDIVDVVSVFRSMNWCGVHSSGYVVLDSFSLSGDFQGEDFKPMYFREYSLRSLIYAQRDFAGGESARAIRYATRDLERYLKEEMVREDHYQSQRREAISLVASVAVPNRVVRVNLRWLQKQVDRLRPLRERCDALAQQHEYGVVYAVRFSQEDIPFLRLSSAMGLRCYSPLARNKIVGKVRVIAEGESLHSGNDTELIQKNRWREEDPNGLLSVLAEAEAKGQAYPLSAPQRAIAHRSPKMLDLTCGVDESEEIARESGTPGLAEYVRQHPRR